MDLLHRAIDARAHEALSEIARMTGSEYGYREHQGAALAIAKDLAGQSQTLPPLFEGVALLSEAWHEQRNWLEESQWEPPEGTREAARRARIKSHIDRGEWAALNLPTPQDALAGLLAGEILEAHGHSVEYDRDGSITWYTNAYGVDGVLCEIPTLVAVRTFLTDMANEMDYGLVPH